MRGTTWRHRHRDCLLSPFNLDISFNVYYWEAKLPYSLFTTVCEYSDIRISDIECTFVSKMPAQQRISSKCHGRTLIPKHCNHHTKPHHTGRALAKLPALTRLAHSLHHYATICGS